MTPSGELLLARTLSHAVERIPFYRQLGLRAPLALEDFPIVDAELLSEREEEFVHFERFPDALLLTGGTRGRPSVVYRSGREYDALIGDLYGLGPGDCVGPESLDSGFAIVLWTAAHGMPLLPARGFPVVNLPLEHAPHARLAQRLIERGIEVAGRRMRPTRLMAAYQLLLMLSDWCWANGVDLADSPIEVVQSNSFHTPAAVAGRSRAAR